MLLINIQTFLRLSVAKYLQTKFETGFVVKATAKN